MTPHRATPDRVGKTDFTHTFAGGDLDRAAHLRSDEDRILGLRTSPEARYLPFRRLDPLVRGDGPSLLAWMTGAEVAALAPGSEPVFLGLDGVVPRFAIAVPPSLEDDAEGLQGARFRGVREVAPVLPTAEAAIIAMGRSLLDWHTTHGFCPRCGGQTSSAQSGHARRCESPRCGAVQFPRVDPVVIMLVHREDRCLLGRAVRARPYPPGLYSCLAGYVEPGETIEEAVRRETLEEAGLAVAGVRYHSSQPWPFPSTLMIGCFAAARTGDVRPDPAEIEEVRWFSREELATALASWGEEGVVRLPPPLTIAHQLAAAWLAEEAV